MMKLVGVTNFLIEKLRVFNWGTEPCGNLEAIFGDATNVAKRRTQRMEFITNWNWVKVTGYLNRDKIALVEFAETMEKEYHKPHSVIVSK